jgi:hypothetical protein
MMMGDAMHKAGALPGADGTNPVQRAWYSLGT